MLDACLAMLCIALACACFTLFCHGVWRAGKISSVRRIQREAPRCPGCKYDLRAQKSLRCPECGAEWSIGGLWTAQCDFDEAD